MKIESDIINEVNKNIQDELEKAQLMELILKVSNTSLNVGHNQLIRSMLKLSYFEPTKFKLILDSNFHGDPRDVLMKAHTKFEGLNYGLTKFK